MVASRGRTRTLLEFSIHVMTFYTLKECQTKSLGDIFQNVCFFRAIFKNRFDEAPYAEAKY